jgi:hypothetical protein
MDTGPALFLVVDKCRTELIRMNMEIEDSHRSVAVFV